MEASKQNLFETMINLKNIGKKCRLWMQAEAGQPQDGAAQVMSALPGANVIKIFKAVSYDFS
jgi:hypothetical protein